MLSACPSVRAVLAAVLRVCCVASTARRRRREQRVRTRLLEMDSARVGSLASLDAMLWAGLLQVGSHRREISQMMQGDQGRARREWVASGRCPGLPGV